MKWTLIGLLLTIPSLLIELVLFYQNKTMSAGKRRAWIVILIVTILVSLFVLIGVVILMLLGK